MNLESLRMMSMIQNELVKQYLILAAEQNAKKFKAETKIREEEISEDKSVISESAPGLMSQVDAIIQETDEIDDDI
jgi:hypothetical protein